tara:strand:- start:6044 stop:6520 length:477 start_codon:yes stop_codon:yes gene_type:complete
MSNISWILGPKPEDMPETWKLRISQLFKQETGESYTDSTFRMLQIPEWNGNRLLINHQDYPHPKSLIGVLWSKQIFDDRVRIVALVIEEQYQGQGLGTKVIKELFTTSREIERNTIQLEVRVSNLRAQKFYQQFGLNIQQTIDNYYADEDGYMMVGTV